MPKASYTVARRRKKRRYFKAAKGYFLGRRKLWRTVQETMHRAWAFSFRDRKAKKREFRKLWIVRISAACRQHGLSYSRFIEGIKSSGIEVNRKMLAQIAITEPKAFEGFVALAKKKLEEKGVKLPNRQAKS